MLNIKLLKNKPFVIIVGIILPLLVLFTGFKLKNKITQDDFIQLIQKDTSVKFTVKSFESKLGFFQARYRLKNVFIQSKDEKEKITFDKCTFSISANSLFLTTKEILKQTNLMFYKNKRIYTIENYLKINELFKEKKQVEKVDETKQKNQSSNKIKIVKTTNNSIQTSTIQKTEPTVSNTEKKESLTKEKTETTSQPSTNNSSSDTTTNTTTSSSNDDDFDSSTEVEETETQTRRSRLQY